MIRHPNLKCDATTAAAFALLFISVFAAGCRSTNPLRSFDGNSASSRNKAQNTPSVKVTVDVVNRYIGFDKDYRATLRDYLVERKARLSDIGAMAAFGRQREMLVQKWKLSERQMNACQELFGAIQASEQLGGKQQLAELEKNQPMQIPADTPEPYKELAKKIEKQRQDEIAKLKRELALTDVRAQFGDAVVDYALQNGGEALKPVTDAMIVNR